MTPGRPSEPAIDPKRVVADGYDMIAERYFAWSDASPSPTRLAWLDRAVHRIPVGTDVLDLVCGAGIPMTYQTTSGRQFVVIATGGGDEATLVAFALGGPAKP